MKNTLESEGNESSVRLLSFYNWFFKRVGKRLLYKQIDEFLDWKVLTRGTDSVHREWLYRFARQTRSTEISEVSDREVFEFVRDLNGAYAKMCAKKALESLLNFHREFLVRKQDNATILDMTRSGRKPNVSKIERAKKLKEVGLSYREIAAVMKSDVKTVYRWHKYPEDKMKIEK